MRLDGWLPRLLEYIELVRETPYSPVTHNCALFVAGALQAMRGISPLEELGISIRSESDVDRVLAEYGGTRGLATRYLGEPLAPLQAGRGDVVIKDGLNGETLGLCVGDHALFLCESGLQHRKLTDCTACWRV